MARPTDPQKIENLKKATMDMIVKYGYRGASIAAIAKEAGVSTGYLYRYYKSKEELIDDLIETELERGFRPVFETVTSYTSLYNFLYDLISRLFEVMREDKIKARFAIAIAFEYDYVELKKKEECTDYDFDKYILELGHKTGEVNTEYNEDDILMIIPAVPLQYIAANLEKTDYQERLDEKAAERIARMCINALR